MARLRMTNADYVAIAVSPALVMALVGSLVFFLIEVLYVGDYTVRLNYVFALFVFATVLIARIAIEMGSERAAMFSLPLGLLMFLALGRFVEHAGALGWLINLGLLAGVWWSSHKLTWDCTVIDDNQDSSGEGLLGRVGLDPLEGEGAGKDRPDKPAGSLAVGNELFNDPGDGEAAQPNLWQRLVSANTGPHTPGLWVLYFSLAALPLFGVGQHWIPASDVGRRRYAFGLLAVYVAAGLSLLVTTSFLGLRRYLRQRNVEMPAPMAATWVTLGGVLILLVMFVAALLPRPAAEYAVAQPPWRVGSPGDNSANRLSAGNEGTVDPDADQRVTSDNQADAPPTGDAAAEATSEQSIASDQAGEGAPQGEGKSDSSSDESNNSEPSNNAPSPNEPSPSDEADRPVDEDGEQGEASQSQNQNERESSNDETEESGSSEESPPGKPQSNEEAQTASESSPPQSPLPDVSAMMATLTSSIGALVKLVCYALLALAVCYFAWRNWPAIVRAFFEIVQMIRDLIARLFGATPAAADAVGAGQTGAAPAPRRTFAEFTDPFLSGRDKKASPVELVRYTFEAFEAWSGDRGQVRTPDQTPQEFLRVAAPPQSPLHEEARRMVRLYSEVAYASANVSRETAATLRQLWHLMQSVR
ncbi:MAG: hypothetical protein C0485_02845 [Pirellula sp.]|nr:hypothetical protein [Pirellula sp.]